MRTVKPFSPPANLLTRPDIAEQLIVSETVGDGTHCEDFLFVARPLRGRHFAYEGINHAFEAVLGLSSREVPGLDVFHCMGSEDSESVCEVLQACLAEGAEVRIHHSLTLGGLRRNVETTVVPILDPVDGVIVRLMGRHRLLLKESPEDEPDERGDFRSSVSLASIQEDIQQRIASELHDSTCQHLVAASLGLMRVRTCLGTAGGVERLCVGIGIDAGVDRLPYESQRSLLRVVQEGLTNIFRHAKATEVKIGVEATDGQFRLTISDNGRGFPVHRAKQGRGTISMGVGIPAMRARLAHLGGSLEIRSGPERSGTMLCAVFPLRNEAKRRKRRSPLQS